MTIDFPTTEQIPQLRALWQDTFKDSDAYLDSFFSLGFSPERCRCMVTDGQVVSVVYWFSCCSRGRKIAYLYAIATKSGYRHRGYALHLLKDTHAHLVQAGYCGAILTPATTTLFALYEKAGYVPGTKIRRLECDAGYVPIPLEQISVEEYYQCRSIFLPAGSVLQDARTLQFLDTQAQFYQGEDFLFCGNIEHGALHTQEFLGDYDLAPRILRALKVKRGEFRGPGEDCYLTMYHALTEEGEPSPSYFGLPMD